MILLQFPDGMRKVGHVRGVPSVNMRVLEGNRRILKPPKNPAPGGGPER